MNKNLALPVEIRLIVHPEQTVLRLSFRREAISERCLGLCLLQENLIETLELSEQISKNALKIRLGPKRQEDRVSRVALEPETSLLEITRNHLTYLLHFFLVCYRDGAGEVDHLDLEAINADTGKKDVYVTFQLPEAKPPMSREQVEALLRRRH